MSTDHIQTLLSELTEQEQQQFEQLLDELKLVKGDMTQLSPEHQQMLAELAASHYEDDESQASEIDNTEVPLDVTATDTASTDEEITPTPAPAEVPDHSPTDTPFGQYVVDHIKTLTEGGSSMADAVRYAFHNKYLPPSLREEVICKDVLQRYQADILTLADSFKSLESAHLADAKLLVGFAWFAVVYDCYQYIEAYGDLS